MPFIIFIYFETRLELVVVVQLMNHQVVGERERERDCAYPPQSPPTPPLGARHLSPSLASHFFQFARLCPIIITLSSCLFFITLSHAPFLVITYDLSYCINAALLTPRPMRHASNTHTFLTRSGMGLASLAERAVNAAAKQGMLSQVRLASSDSIGIG